MSEQPELESRYTLDSRGNVWVREGGAWIFPPDDPTIPEAWSEVDKRHGPMTPLLPAVRPDGVPDDAVPFVGWVVPASSQPQHYGEVRSPTGRMLRQFSRGSAEDLGIPAPAPAPSLPERLREAAERGSTPETERLLLEAADALDARSQP